MPVTRLCCRCGEDKLVTGLVYKTGAYKLMGEQRCSSCGNIEDQWELDEDVQRKARAAASKHPLWYLHHREIRVEEK